MGKTFKADSLKFGEALFIYHHLATVLYKANMPKGIQSKSEYKRTWRKKNREEKQFNKVLKKYLKTKHVSIYEECCDFFRVLSEKNPTAKDLTKTRTFKKWEEKSTKSDSDDEPIMMFTYNVKPGSETVTLASVEGISRGDISVNNDDEGQQREHNEVRDNGEHQHDHSEVRNNGEQRAEQQAGQQHNYNEQNNIIERLVNELEMDRDLYDLLNGDEPQHNGFVEDEGIGLNIEDEIVDPLDVELEMNLYGL